MRSQNGARNPWSAPTTELWTPTGRDAGGLLCGRPDGAAHPQRSLLEHFPLGENADRSDVEVGVALLWLAHDEITGGLL